jgi:hypothetical protein
MPKQIGGGTRRKFHEHAGSTSGDFVGRGHVGTGVREREKRSHWSGEMLKCFGKIHAVSSLC